MILKPWQWLLMLGWGSRIRQSSKLVTCRQFALPPNLIVWVFLFDTSAYALNFCPHLLAHVPSASTGCLLQSQRSYSSGACKIYSHPGKWWHLDVSDWQLSSSGPQGNKFTQENGSSEVDFPWSFLQTKRPYSLVRVKSDGFPSLSWMNNLYQLSGLVPMIHHWPALSKSTALGDKNQGSGDARDMRAGEQPTQMKLKDWTILNQPSPLPSTLHQASTNHFRSFIDH